MLSIFVKNMSNIFSSSYSIQNKMPYFEILLALEFQYLWVNNFIIYKEVKKVEILDSEVHHNIVEINDTFLKTVPLYKNHNNTLFHLKNICAYFILHTKIACAYRYCYCCLVTKLCPTPL